MSGGPQVFLGATTFLSDCVCLNASPPDLRPVRGRAAWCARGRRPAREPSAPRASLGASSRSPARPSRRPRAPQPGPASLVAASNRAALIPFRPGPAAAHGHRSQASQASRWPPIGRPLALQEIRRGPAQKRIRAGPLLLALTRQRVSSLLGRCTRRSTPRRRWGGSNRAGWPVADST